MENNPSLFAAAALESPVDLAAALALPATSGHFDELHGRTLDKAVPAQSQSQQQSQSSLHLAGSAPATAPSDAAAQPGIQARLAPDWHRFFNFLGGEGFEDLNHRAANLRRQIRDNGVTYNVYADADGPQRPWSLDLFPLVLSAADWSQISAGISQRARLLDRIMADVYGPQQLLSLGLLPTALVQGHPGYLRAMHGVQPAGGTFLHIAAFDLARGPDGRWWVVSQRTQAPSGLGYLLENRLAISRLFPQAFREMKVQALAASYKALIDGMKAHSPASAGADKRIVLLTPGPYNETYFEHAYLARYLGLTLVEGSDLLVRDNRLYLKTLQGLEPVHGLLKRLDDEFLDPLELRSDSTLGVPGLLQAIRAGNVLVANAPGSAFLESSALLGFLPALSRHLLDEPLALPSLATWWCGEQAALQEVLPLLKDCVIRGTYPGSGIDSVIAQTLTRRQLDEWAGRLLRRSDDYTVQAYLPLSQTPTWHGNRLAPRSAMLRVFAVADGSGSWQVLPGGLARLAGANDKIASMQQGGSSADVWALGEPDAAPAPQAPADGPARRGAIHESAAEPGVPAPIASLSRHKPPVTSRAAENLFWLGRYTERTENAIRLAQLTLQSLSGEDQSSQPLLAWLSELTVKNGLVLDSVPPATQARRVFERSLIASLADTESAASVGYNLRALKGAASAVRERLSQEQWHVIVRAEEDFFRRCEAFSGPDHPAAQALEYSSVEALHALESASSFLAAMTGAQTDRMTRDDGWRLLSTGRHIERLNTLAAALVLGFETGAVHDEAGFGAIVALFDSTITFHAQYQQQRDVPALLDLLVFDRDNPRSLGWVVQTLRGRLARLAENTVGAPQPVPDLTPGLPDPGAWQMADLCTADPRLPEGQRYEGLLTRLEECCSAAFDLSDTLSRRYFSHVSADEHSLGA